MRGREFLDAARDLAAGPGEPHWRGAIVHAYYALLLECRDALARWGRPLPPRANVHSWVRLQFTYAGDADLRSIGKALDLLVQNRNRASYDLTASSLFSSATTARLMIREATNALARLDAIEADPTRLAAAVASLPP